MSNNTKRRAERRRAQRAAVRAAIEVQFGVKLPTSRPTVYAIAPGRVMPVVLPGRKHVWLKGGGWVPAFRAPITYSSRIGRNYA